MSFISITIGHLLCSYFVSLCPVYDINHSERPFLLLLCLKVAPSSVLGTTWLNPVAGRLGMHFACCNLSLAPLGWFLDRVILPSLGNLIARTEESDLGFWCSNHSSCIFSPCTLGFALIPYSCSTVPRHLRFLIPAWLLWKCSCLSPYRISLCRHLYFYLCAAMSCSNSHSTSNPILHPEMICLSSRILFSSLECHMIV